MLEFFSRAMRAHFNVYTGLIKSTINAVNIAIGLFTSQEHYHRSTKAEKMSALGLFSAILLALRLDVNLAKSVMSRTSPITKENAMLFAGSAMTLAFSAHKLLAAQQRIRQEQFAAMAQDPVLQAANIGVVAAPPAEQLNQIVPIQLLMGPRLNPVK